MCEFIGQSEHAQPIFASGRDQAWLRLQSFGKIELGVPQRARPFVIPDHDWRTAVPTR
jgi:hypothetical protein